MATESLLLFRRAQEGDASAGEDLFARLQPQVHRFVRRRMGARLRLRADSMDVVQSVLVEGVRKIDSSGITTDSELLRYLMRVAKNKLNRIDREMRYQGRNPQQNIGIGGKDSDAPGFEPAGEGSTPSIRLMEREQREWVLRLVGRLPERERKLVELRKLAQLSWEETMERCEETNLKAARNAFARAMARLAGWAASEG